MREGERGSGSVVNLSGTTKKSKSDRKKAREISDFRPGLRDLLMTCDWTTYEYRLAVDLLCWDCDDDDGGIQPAARRLSELGFLFTAAYHRRLIIIFPIKPLCGRRVRDFHHASVLWNRNQKGRGACSSSSSCHDAVRLQPNRAPELDTLLATLYFSIKNTTKIARRSHFFGERFRWGWVQRERERCCKEVGVSQRTYPGVPPFRSYLHQAHGRTPSPPSSQSTVSFVTPPHRSSYTM